VTPSRDAIRLVEPDSVERWATARRLVEEYAASRRVYLGFQDFAHEVQSLARIYGPPDGTFLLAERADAALGCVALRRFSEGVCEMKRLYVAPAGRGAGIGRTLVGAIIVRARRLGYARMWLDTLASMTEARALYLAVGFRPIPPYRYNPIAGTTYLELVL
jgi:putative acetyltransferase